MPTIAEEWEQIFRALKLDCTQPVKYITADQIKGNSDHDLRLMVSMDSEKKRPKIFRDHGVFILPVSLEKFAIIHGNGYHELEDTGPPQKFRARYPFDMVMLGFGSGETRHLLHAWHSGLLEHFTKVPQLYETMSGKGRVGKFDFRVDGSESIPVNGAQMEVDKGFESPNANDLLLFEAKAARPKTFIIRQLYYPYRVASEFVDKTVRSFFFAADPKTNTYNLWEYRWQDPLDYEDISLAHKGSFIFEAEEPPVEILESIEPDSRLDIVPQADDFQKVADYPFLVQSGIDSAKAWSDRYDIALRQGDYYKEAAEALGLLDPQEGRFVLTVEGRRYISMDPKHRADFLAERILRIPLMNEVFRLTQRRPNGVGEGDIVRLIERRTFSGTTPGRRASTVLSWFRWLARATGAVVVHEGRIYPRSSGLDRFT